MSDPMRSEAADWRVGAFRRYEPREQQAHRTCDVRRFGGRERQLEWEVEAFATELDPLDYLI